MLGKLIQIFRGRDKTHKKKPVMRGTQGKQKRQYIERNQRKPEKLKENP
jgi:hypothetical protein